MSSSRRPAWRRWLKSGAAGARSFSVPTDPNCTTCAVPARNGMKSNLQPDTMTLLEQIRDGQHLDVEPVDFAGHQRLRIGVGVERTQFGRAGRILLTVRGLQPALGDVGE